MPRIALIVAGILVLTMIDFDWAIKHHRNRGEHHREEESLLDKHEREKDKNDRKRDEHTEENRNLTCYKCDGDLCRDPFQSGTDIPTAQCNYSCWKGVFVGSVRRSCGNKRCSFAFQGSSAMSNTCCRTSFCNQSQMIFPSMMMIMILFSSLIIIIKLSD